MFKYYKDLMEKDKKQALKEIGYIKDTDLAISLMKVFGNFIYDNLNNELKNNNEILKYIFKNTQEKSIDIFKNMNEEKQELLFPTNPKKLYPFLKNPNNKNIVQTLLDNKLINLLSEENIKANYDFITELILKDIEILQYSNLHLNDKKVVLNVIKKYDLKDVKRIFALKDDKKSIVAAIDFFQDKNKVILFIQKNRQTIYNFLAQNIDYINEFKSFFIRLEDYFELVLLNTSSTFCVKLLDKIKELDKNNSRVLMSDLLIMRCQYFYENLSIDDKKRLVTEVIFTIITYNREKQFKDIDYEENQTVISTVLFLLLLCECKKKITIAELIEELKAKIKNTLERKKASLPSEIYINRIANQIAKLQKKPLFKNCSLEYLVLAVIFCGDDGENIKPNELPPKDPFFMEERLKNALIRTAKDFDNLKIDNDIFDLDDDFIDIQNIQKTLNYIVLFNNIFLEQDCITDKSDLDAHNELNYRFTAVFLSIVEGFINNNKELYKIKYANRLIATLDYYHKVPIYFKDLDTLYKMI